MSDIARFDAQAGTIVAGGRRIVFHCHHYNTLLQRSVDDALGARASLVQRAAATEASRGLLSGLPSREGEGFEGRMAAAVEVFKTLGFGLADVSELGPFGGQVTLLTSHYALGWRTKLGRAPAPVCHLAVGFFAAAQAVAAGVPIERVMVDELACGAMGDERCRLVIEVL